LYARGSLSHWSVGSEIKCLLTIFRNHMKSSKTMESYSPLLLQIGKPSKQPNLKAICDNLIHLFNRLFKSKRMEKTISSESFILFLESPKIIIYFYVRNIGSNVHIG
jgi:hypothetical protein